MQARGAGGVEVRAVMAKAVEAVAGLVAVTWAVVVGLVAVIWAAALEVAVWASTTAADLGRAQDSRTEDSSHSHNTTRHTTPQATPHTCAT